MVRGYIRNHFALIITTILARLLNVVLFGERVFPGYGYVVRLNYRLLEFFSSSRKKRTLFAVGFLTFQTFVTAQVFAKQNVELGYTYETIWSAAVRYIRVDQQFAIRDRDPDSGYILFEYKQEGKAVPGSVEIVPVQDGRQVRVSIQIVQMPSYIERMLLDGLKKKLISEHGDAPKISDKNPKPKDHPKNGNGQEAEPPPKDSSPKTN